MAVSVHPGKRARSVVWSADTSVRRTTHDSPVFSMENGDWNLTLKIQCRGGRAEQDWMLYLNKIGPDDGHHVFIVNVSIEDRNRTLECLNYAKVTLSKRRSERILWRCKSQVLATYPDIVLDGDVTFVVTFLSDYRRIADLENAEASRSVQTPPHLDVQPCVDTLRSDFGRLLDDRLHTDVELQCGQRAFPAHRVVLAARSEVFAAMLQNEMLEKRRGSVQIVDMSHSSLDLFLKYLYTGTLPELTTDIASELYEAADKYAVRSLRTRCADFLKEHLSEGNACRLLALADAHSDQELKEYVMSYIVRKDLLVKLMRHFLEKYPDLALDKIFESYKSSQAARPEQGFENETSAS